MNCVASYARQSLQTIYPPQELKSLIRIICCDLLGQSVTDFYLGKDIVLSEKQWSELKSIIARLEKNEPIQYIEGKSHFFGRCFKVASGVLIPRPETEELVGIIVSENRKVSRILDIGTGSGCIAITLAKEIPGASVCAWDISDEALIIAQNNNAKWNAAVVFKKVDILSDDISVSEKYDVIVSNPPYITEKEKKEMEPNVLDWEPEIALFVPNDDPLRFYRRIAFLGRDLLSPEGKLYFEINRAYGADILRMLVDMGYQNCRLIKDLSGNDRIVIADR